MDNNKQDVTSYILDTLIQKSITKQNTYSCTLENFLQLKKVMKFLIGNYKKQIKDYGQKINMQFSENGIFEAKMQVAGDLIVFNMHSNVFTFDDKHWVWEHDYIKQNNLNAYFGVINIYNFLADSFKYRRLEDYGFIISRLFINQEGHFFLEGNPDFGLFNEDFGKHKLDMSILREIVHLIIQYSLEVDLIIPKLEDMQVTTVEQMISKMDRPKINTGKPMGFQSNAQREHKKNSNLFED